MKRCPTCQRTYEEDSQKFCANDGTPLVADETPAFDPEATVMSIPRPLLEEQPPADAQPAPEQQPTQYFNPPNPEPPSQPEQNVHQSYPPPPPSPGATPAWPPAQQQQQQQQPYYPQQGMAGGQPQALPWQGGQQQPQQGWTPGQQPQQQQGQNWGGGGGYYPQQQPPGQYAPQAGKSLALSLVTLIVGLISFINWAIIFGMYQRIIAPDRSVAEVVVYVALIPGILAVLLGIITLISSRWRNKGMAIAGMLIGLPGIIFFIYLASEGRLP
jgi:hypothetical protein